MKTNGVNLIERTFEEFNTTYYFSPNSQSSRSNISKKKIPIESKCPPITFDQQLDVTNDNYMFQIFNSDGQYGYAVGGNKPDKQMTPFTAAYSTVDTYLSSLPNTKYMKECADLYSSEISNFGLCDPSNLNKILQYQKNIQSGKSKPYFDGTDYSTNTNVVNAIKHACLL